MNRLVTTVVEEHEIVLCVLHLGMHVLVGLYILVGISRIYRSVGLLHDLAEVRSVFIGGDSKVSSLV